MRQRDPRGLFSCRSAGAWWDRSRQYCKHGSPLELFLRLDSTGNSEEPLISALTQLDATCKRYPKAIWPRVVRSHVLLQEGSDLAAAEQALNEVLQLDPEDAQARHNLSLVRQQRDST